MAWTSVEKAAKNDQGQFMALVGGQWRPAARVAKNDQGAFVAEFDDAPAASAQPLPESLDERVAMIPGATAPAPARTTPVPAAQPEEGGVWGVLRSVSDTVKGVRGVLNDLVGGSTFGAAGAAGGLISGLAKTISQGKLGTDEGANQVEQSAVGGMQAGMRNTIVGDVEPTEMQQTVGEVMRRHGGAVVAAPFGVGGMSPAPREAIGQAKQAVGTAARAGAARVGEVGLDAATRAVGVNPTKLENVASAERFGLTPNVHHVTERPTIEKVGQATQHVPLGGGKVEQNTKAFTKALVQQLNPDDKSVQLNVGTYNRAMDRSGKIIGETMSSVDTPMSDQFRAQLSDLSRDAVENGAGDVPRLITNRINELINKAELNGGKVSGQAMRELDSAIGKQIRSNAKDLDLVGRLRDLQEAMRDQVEALLPEGSVAKLRDARKRYAYAMSILPDLDDFGKTGYYEPGKLWDRVTSDTTGRLRVANERGGELVDLAKAGALVAEPQGHPRLTVGTTVGIGTTGAVAYLNPAAAAGAAGTAVGVSRVYNRFGPALVKRLAKLHDERNAPPPPTAPPPLELAPDGPLPPSGGGGGAPPSPLGDLTPQWETSPGAAPAGPALDVVPTEGLHPAVGDRTPPMAINPPRRGRIPVDIPAVPGRPDLPDTMVTGGLADRPGQSAEVAATDRANTAMVEPGAIESRRAIVEQRFTKAGGKTEPGQFPTNREPTGPDPRLTEIEALRAKTESPAVHKVLDKRKAEVEKTIKAEAAARKREADVAEIEAAAQATADPDLRRTLLAEADKLRTEKLPTGEVKEGQPTLPVEKPGKVPVGQAKEVPLDEVVPAPQPDGPPPVGEATEVMPEVVEPVPGPDISEPLPVGEATEVNVPPAPKPPAPITPAPKPPKEVPVAPKPPKAEPARDVLTGPTGAPLTLYRAGSPAGKPVRGKVPYFTERLADAQDYARTRRGEGYAAGDTQIREANLVLRNPARDADIRRVAEANGIDLLHPDYPAAYLDGSPELVAALKAEGFDGAIGLDGRPGDGREITSYAVFSPEQVVDVRKPKEVPRAPDQVPEQGRVQQERVGRNEGRAPAEAGVGDRVQREAQVGGQGAEAPALTSEQEATWRKEHKLGADDAERAKAVARALQVDEQGVVAAATKHENRPAAFDAEIERINRSEAPMQETKETPNANLTEEPAPRSASPAPVDRAPAAAGNEPRAKRPAAAGGRSGQGAAEEQLTAAGWAKRMAELRKTKPRPLEKLFGRVGPTPEQAERHAERVRRWNAEYRRASKMQKETLAAENAARRAINDAD